MRTDQIAAFEREQAKQAELDKAPQEWQINPNWTDAEIKEREDAGLPLITGVYPKFGKPDTIK